MTSLSPKAGFPSIVVPAGFNLFQPLWNSGQVRVPVHILKEAWIPTIPGINVDGRNINSVVVKDVVIVVMLFASFAAMAMGQDNPSEDRDQVSRLDLDFAFGLPGDQAFLVLSLDAPAGVSVGSVESEISFPTKLLSFKYATKGASAAAVGAEAKTKMQRDPEDADKTILKVNVSPQEKSPLKALPNGGLANLTFQISPVAEIGTNISLENKVRAWTTGVSPKPLKPFSGGDGQIHVTRESLAIFSCFFYMH